MSYVYILESVKNGKFYIGSTTNLQDRIRRHNKGDIHTTKRFLPVKLIFKQEYPDIKVARKIEYKLKRLKRKDYLRKIVKNGVINLKNSN